jgi:hypothetical protein
MRVNIPVTGPDMNWIVGRLAKELVARLPRYGFDAQINRETPADIEYHSNVYGPPKGHGRVAIGLFAHDDGRPGRYARLFDGQVVLNPEMQQLILGMVDSPDMAGHRRRPTERLPVVIEQAVDDCFLPRHRPVFGVAGSVKAGNPRKGERFIQKMVEQGYDVRAWGSGWPCPIVSDRYEDLPAFYRSLDYYVCTSTLEGGCSPIIECMAMNVPVIAPRIGFAIVRPVLEYEAGNWESLENVLKYLTRHRTYEDWAADHAEYFRRFL